MKIDDIAIKLELERVLSSRCFRSRHILRKFLSYIVQETMEGRADEITQYAIATKGLGKPSDFIAGESPLIRVQAGRLARSKCMSLVRSLDPRASGAVASTIAGILFSRRTF